MFHPRSDLPQRGGIIRQPAVNAFRSLRVPQCALQHSGWLWRVYLVLVSLAAPPEPLRHCSVGRRLQRTLASPRRSPAAALVSRRGAWVALGVYGTAQAAGVASSGQLTKCLNFRAPAFARQALHQPGLH